MNYLAPLLGGFAVKGPEIAGNWVNLFKNVQDIRNEGNTEDALRKLEDFKTSQEAEAFRPQGLGAENYAKLQKLRAERTAALLAREAEPGKAQIAALRDDPRFQDAASLTEIQRDPAQAVFGQTRPSNPEVGTALQEYGRGVGNVLDQFRARTERDPMALSRIGVDPKLAKGFSDVAGADENITQTDQLVASKKAEGELSRFIADNPAPATVEEWNGFWDRARKIKDLPMKLVADTQKDVRDRNRRVVRWETMRVGNGPNSTVKRIGYDMFGEPVPNATISSTDNPSDRELGITGGKGGGKDTSPPEYFLTQNDPDLPPIREHVPYNPDPDSAYQRYYANDKTGRVLPITDKTQIKAMKALSAPKSGKRTMTGIGGLQRGGGAPAAAPAASGGGYTYVNGKLVAN